MSRLQLAICAALLLGGCGERDDGGPLAVSVIGAPILLHDPGETLPEGADAAVLSATAQGLVRFDEGAQIVPGVAIRWAISDDGLYYTFRLDRELANADPVAAMLRRLVSRYRQAPFGAKLDVVRDIVAVTPEVIEIRLSAPRPELITLLAGPAFVLPINGKGTGPLVVDGEPGRRMTLRTRPIEQAAGGEGAPPGDQRRIHVRGERVALAVARFAEGEAALVTGGSFDDILYPRLARIAPRNLQIDPATGLFGLSVARPGPLLMAVEIRQALSMTLDRDALGQALGVPGWRPIQAILPPGLTDIPEPTRPFWAQALANVRGSDDRALAARVDVARRIVAQWRSQHGHADRPRLVLAMPRGPGGAILFAAIRRQWRAIGIDAIRVGPRQPADLRLIDEVAPADQADWFLAHFLCDRGRPCSDEADQVFRKALEAIDPAERARMIAEAEQRLAAISPFIPIAQPVRWSLAAPNLRGFKPNARASHPLAALIDR